ncbi:methionine biosynthesis protein MetW [Coraliomargarita parva]|uniref:methionine biosynthesis protein MetW n=1 Tax=Coraliomargarita parva TaxID=3014050 RepID=UPI0022B5DC23|nr:methionine biosynthesis protein MetW [Coraliomargarita parva]
MNPNAKKRQVDFQVIAEWVNEGDRVLDLGCGRGVLLEYLKQKKSIYGLGVDIEFDKVLSCVKRGVPAYQGDIRSILAKFPDGAFDRVIFSRTVEQLDSPDAILAEGLRVGGRVTVGFVNHGYWVNRLNYLLKGQRTLNDVYPKPWYSSLPANPFSIDEFESFCRDRGIHIRNRVLLSGNWKGEQKFLPNLFSGYGIYDLSR